MQSFKAAVRYAIGRGSLGFVVVAAGAKGLCAVLLGEDPEELVTELRRRFADSEPDAADLGVLLAQVVEFIERPEPRMPFATELRGTPFQRRVWQALLEIPFGETRSYGAVASSIGAPRAVRAVAQACANNPLAVLVPCHRVLSRDGSLTGYRWGLERKRLLLERERTGSCGQASFVAGN